MARVIAVVLSGLVGLFIVVGPSTGAVAAPAAYTAQDKAFLQGAHEMNLAEIAAGKLALRMANEAVTKRLAARWITDHTKLDNSLRPVAKQLGVDLPVAPDVKQRALLHRYELAAGPTFDGVWVSTQRQSHLDARRLVDTELERGSNAKVVALAKQASPVVNAHATLLDQAAPALGAAPGKVDAGNGISDGPQRRMALWFLAVGILLVGGSAWLLARARGQGRPGAPARRSGQGQPGAPARRSGQAG